MKEVFSAVVDLQLSPVLWAESGHSVSAVVVVFARLCNISERAPTGIFIFFFLCVKKF